MAKRAFHIFASFAATVGSPTHFGGKGEWSDTAASFQDATKSYTLDLQ